MPKELGFSPERKLSQLMKAREEGTRVTLYCRHLHTAAKSAHYWRWYVLYSTYDTGTAVLIAAQEVPRSGSNVCTVQAV